MGQTLSEPVVEKHSEEDESESLICGSSNMQGWRRRMEDAQTQILRMKTKDVAFFGVFDGHGGEVVAEYAGVHLHEQLEQEGAFQAGEYSRALRSAFLNLDDSLQNDPEFKGEPSGCAAVVALVSKDEIHVANAGDSRAVLCSGGEAVPLSFDHKPGNTTETARIVKAGGFVEFGRVNGNLALSRALGDFEFKQAKSLSPSEQIITADPDIEIRKIQPDDEFLIVACDGIWDCVTSQTAVDFVRLGIRDGIPLGRLCEKLIDYCLAPHSEISGIGCDNMTLIIVGILGGRTKSEWYRDIGSRVTGPPLAEAFKKEPASFQSNTTGGSGSSSRTNGSSQAGTIAGIKVGGHMFHVQIPFGSAGIGDGEDNAIRVVSVDSASGPSEELEEADTVEAVGATTSPSHKGDSTDTIIPDGDPRHESTAQEEPTGSSSGGH